MTKCGKSFLPECEYFTTGGCISPFNCPYKIEHESITTATSTPLNSNVVYTDETYKDKEITRLTAENDNLTVELEVAQRDIDNLTRTLEEANDEIKALEAENEELRATLSKMEKVENAVDLPCKVGDNIYVRYYNNKEKRHCVEVERVSKTNFNITNGILSGTVYTYDFSKRHEEDNCYNMRDYNKKWFTDRVAAEARLAELKGGME